MCIRDRSYLVLSAFGRRPRLAYSYTYTQQKMLTPRVISSLSSVVLTHGITSGTLCATAVRLRTVVCVPFFRFFFSYLVLPACHCRPLLPYSYTYTQQRMLTARVISSPSSVVLTHGITNGSLSPECFLYVQRTAYDPWYHEWIPLPRVLLVRTAYIVSRPHLFSAACLIRVHGT